MLYGRRRNGRSPIFGAFGIPCSAPYRTSICRRSPSPSSLTFSLLIDTGSLKMSAGQHGIGYRIIHPSAWNEAFSDVEWLRRVGTLSWCGKVLVSAPTHPYHPTKSLQRLGSIVGLKTIAVCSE